MIYLQIKNFICRLKLPNTAACIAILLGILCAACESQDITLDMPEADPTTDETPQVQDAPSPPQQEEPIVAKTKQQARLINASIQNEIDAREQLTICFAPDNLVLPDAWTSCIMYDDETGGELTTISTRNTKGNRPITFIADNERHIQKSFTARFEYYLYDSTAKTSTLVSTDYAMIYTPINVYYCGLQNREGKSDQGLILLNAGEVKYMSTINDRTGASDCAMRFVVRLPEGHKVIITKSVASIAGGTKPMSTHFRLANYNASCRAELYPEPDDPIYHYDDDTTAWITKDAYTIKDAGVHIVHIVPDSADFDDSEIIAYVEHTDANGQSESGGVSMYYVPEKIDLLKEVIEKSQKDKKNR